MKQPVYWTTKSGTRINVDYMDVNHLRNTLKMIIRAIDSSSQEVSKSISKQRFRMNGELANDDADMAMLYSISPELTCTCYGHYECQQCYEDRKNEHDLNVFESNNC
jgi:hypothetical protein